MAYGYSKYRNKKTVVDGMTFHSKREAKHYEELKALQKLGVISDLQCQVPFILSVDGKKLGKLILDFTYKDSAGSVVYVDVKSKPTITAIFKWKAKHFEAQYKQKITLVL